MSRHTILSICVVLPALSGLLAACARNTDLLPHSVYYLSGIPGDYHVWRMEADGTTTTQLIDEGLGVDDFSVSMADGSLAFISNNQLFLVDGDGQNRRLVSDGSQVDKQIEDYVFRGFVESPGFSPDGRTLAYAFDGLHLYNVASGQDEHVLTNLGNLLGETFVFNKENYYPGPWSPDGNKLLIIMGYFEGSTLAIMEPGKEEPFRRLRSDGPVCCTYHWTPDGSSVLVANPSFGVQWPGLWRYDAGSGEEFELVTTLPDQPKFVGWPVQLPSGDLLYFYGERFTPEEGIPLVMVQSGPDGGDRTQIRPEEFHVAQALWAEDGSLVLIHTFLGDLNSESRSERIVLARPDGSPLQVLIETKDIQQMEWGP
jgi:Tol biopolymer transport system component